MRHPPRPITYEDTKRIPKEVLDMFYAKQVPNGDCMEWTGYIHAKYGYGQIYALGKCLRVHRLALALNGVDLTGDLVADHICRNRKCVNPKHLRAVTGRQNTFENSNGIAATNIKKTHCYRGHDLRVPENLTSPVKGHEHWRICRLCRVIHTAKRSKKRAEKKALTLPKPSKKKL